MLEIIVVIFYICGVFCCFYRVVIDEILYRFLFVEIEQCLFIQSIRGWNFQYFLNFYLERMMLVLWVGQSILWLLGFGCVIFCKIFNQCGSYDFLGKFLFWVFGCSFFYQGLANEEVVVFMFMGIRLFFFLFVLEEQLFLIWVGIRRFTF